MKRKLLFLFSFFTLQLFAQSGSTFIGKTEQVIMDNGVLKTRTVLTPQQYNPVYNNPPFNPVTPPSILNSSSIRWIDGDATAIGDRCVTSGDGRYQAVAWDLNNLRVDFHNNSGATPLWSYPSNPNTYINHIAISDTGGAVANGSYQNIYVFNRAGTPIFNYDLTRLSDTGIAGPVALTRNGQFLVACASRNDSSTIFGFNVNNSATPVWSFKVNPGVVTGGAGIQGIKMAGYDSLVIVNTYLNYYILRVSTGQLIFQGSVNPGGTSGTQTMQGISGNGNIIATINYNGFLRVYQRSGNSYSPLWAHQEVPGQYYNWMYAVDISDDGKYIACGTLNFRTSSSYQGKIKVFETTNGGTPKWSFVNLEDAVPCVSFSRNGKILAAASWGDLANAYDDLLVFKTDFGAYPLYSANSSGSFFWCNVSNDGKTVVGSGKAVHARQFGNGGLLYNLSIDTSETPVGIFNGNNTAGSYRLDQNFRNPFNTFTTINYTLQSEGNVKLVVYNILGEESGVLVNSRQSAGEHKITFDGSSFSSGIYYYKITAGSFTAMRKMILVK